MPVQDLEMGFEKIVKISHARGGMILISYIYGSCNAQMYLTLAIPITVCKRQDAIAKLKAEVSFKFLSFFTFIPFLHLMET